MAKRRPSGDGMVRKREDGRWEGRIVVGHKQNGEPIFRYVLAKNQKELLDKLHRDMEGFQDMELTEDSRMTLASGWAGGWRTMVRLPCGPTPCGVMSSSSGATSSPTWGIRSSPGVTRMDIQKLYRKLKHEGRVHGHPEHGHE